MPKKCKHNWKNNGTTCTERYERCSKCNERRTVKLTKEEQRKEKKQLREMLFPKPEHNVHRVYHRFCRIFGDGLTIPWKYKGYEMMKRVQRWAKYYPDDVQILRCDDNHYCGSDLILIKHKSKGSADKPPQYHGITVVYIPQCSGEDPVEFFLYPDHQIELEKALKASRIASQKLNGWKM